jgi:hypothetical protein
MLEDMTDGYNAESKRLEELEEHFRKMDRDQANEDIELRLIAAEEERIFAIENRLALAASRIQAAYRGRKCRQQLSKRKVSACV